MQKKKKKRKKTTRATNTPITPFLSLKKINVYI